MSKPIARLTELFRSTLPSSPPLLPGVPSLDADVDVDLDVPGFPDLSSALDAPPPRRMPIPKRMQDAQNAWGSLYDPGHGTGYDGLSAWERPSGSMQPHPVVVPGQPCGCRFMPGPLPDVAGDGPPADASMFEHVCPVHQRHAEMFTHIARLYATIERLERRVAASRKAFDTLEYLRKSLREFESIASADRMMSEIMRERSRAT